jgi:hypothetical protein
VTITQAFAVESFAARLTLSAEQYAMPHRAYMRRLAEEIREIAAKFWIEAFVGMDTTEDPCFKAVLIGFLYDDPTKLHVKHPTHAWLTVKDTTSLGKEAVKAMAEAVDEWLDHGCGKEVAPRWMGKIGPFYVERLADWNYAIFDDETSSSARSIGTTPQEAILKALFDTQIEYKPTRHCLRTQGHPEACCDAAGTYFYPPAGRCNSAVEPEFDYPPELG